MGRRKQRPEREEGVPEQTIRSKDWCPSSPHRPPTHVLYVKNGEKFSTFGYCGIFAAKKAFEHIVQDQKFKWISHKEIETEKGIKIKADELEDIVEYVYKKYEHEWDFPDTEQELFGRMRQTQEDRDRLKAERNERLGVSKEEAPRERVQRPERKPRPSREGLTTVQTIAGEFNIDASDARAILRKAKEPKPEAGWAGDDAWANRIRAIIKKGLK